MDVNSISARLLELIRVYANGNKAEFSRKTGINPSTLQNYVDGKRFPSTESLINIRESLSVSTDWLLTGEGSMEAGGEQKAKKDDQTRSARKAFLENRQKFHDALDYIFDQGRSPQRREIMGALIELEEELRDKENNNEKDSNKSRNTE